jgi:predicted deacylase
MAISPIETSIDFERNGKQLGYLRLPHSVHRSAYGWIPIPAACIANGEGPRVLLVAGNHGDEYEGQLVLSRLIQEIDPGELHGRLIILPMANLLAAEAGLRTSPLDDGNLNRSFPGDPNGTPTQITAHYIEEVLLPRVDLLVDLHSGGSSLEYLPSTLPSWDPNCRMPQKDLYDLCREMQLPYMLLFPEDREARYSSAAGLRKGVASIGTEVGGGGRVTRGHAKLLGAGLLHMLRRLGVYSGPVPNKAEPRHVRSMAVRSDHYCYAGESGLLENLVDLGDRVTAGQDVALLHHPETPGREPSLVKAEAEGMVICQRGWARVRRGDCICHLAAELPQS